MGQYDNDNYVIEVKLRDNVSDNRWEPLYKRSPSIREYKEYYKKTIVNSFNPTAERLIRFFMEYDNGVLYPDKFNFCEPVNKPFNESCIAQAVSYLANPAGCVYLKKSRFADIDIENKTFSFGWIDGVYSEPLVPLPNYLTIITVYFPKKKNTDLGFIIQLMKDIKSYFDADNGKVFYQATKEIIAEEQQLRMLLFDGGYVDFSGSEPRYCWYTKDHLGSVRSVVGGMMKLAGETAKTATEGNTKPSGRALSIEQGVLKTEEVSDIHGMYYNPKF